MTITPRPYFRLNKETGRYEKVQPEPIEPIKKGRNIWKTKSITFGKARKK